MPTPTKSTVTIGDQPALVIRHKGDGHWTVWLHVEAGHTERDYGGLCLAVNRDRVRAIGEALGLLNRLHDKLHHYLIHGVVDNKSPDDLPSPVEVSSHGEESSTDP